jgi:protein SCO1/2
MHPEIKSATPGECSKCGMPLKQQSNLQTSTPSRSTPWGANYFPNVSMTTQDGKIVRFYDDLLKDKVVAIELIYTSCKYNCPLETARLSQAQKLLGDLMGQSIFFYSITIDPKHDTPEILKAYAQKFHAGPGWLFLTGKEEDIELISKKLGLYSAPDVYNADGHTPTLLIGSAARGIWMKNVALGDPRFLARWIGDLVDDKQKRTAEVGKSYADAPKLALNKGQYIFMARCAPCHTIGQRTKVTAPDLAGVTSTRDRAWLMRFIASPDRMLADKDPIATALFKEYKEIQMPNLGLSRADIADVIEYIEAQTAALRAGEKAGTTK